MEWLKLKCDLLQNEKIRLIRAEKDGDAMAFLWVGLLCLAGSQEHSGALQIHDKPLTDRMLSQLLGASLQLTRRALELFLAYGMLAEENGVYYLPGWEAHQSVEALENRRQRDRERQRVFRARQKELARGEDVTLRSQKNPLPEEDTDKEKDKEKDTPPLPPSGDGRASLVKGEKENGFQTFWEAYPKKEGREAAKKAWDRLSPDEALCQRILRDVKARRSFPDWEREDGRYVPRPARYLTERRWEDEVRASAREDVTFDANEAFERAVARGRGEKSYDLEEAFAKAEARQRMGLGGFTEAKNDPPETRGADIG